MKRIILAILTSTLGFSSSADDKLKDVDTNETSKISASLEMPFLKLKLDVDKKIESKKENNSFFKTFVKEKITENTGKFAGGLISTVGVATLFSSINFDFVQSLLASGAALFLEFL